MSDLIVGPASSLPPNFIEFEGGVSVVKDEYLTPNFEDKEVNRDNTAAFVNSVKLKLKFEGISFNFSAEANKRIAGPENPHYPEGFRIFGSSIQGRNLAQNHIDFKLGRIPVKAGSTFGLVDGGEVSVHSPNSHYSLGAFLGAVPEPFTLHFSERIGWGAFGRAELLRTWIDASFYQVRGEDRSVERERVGASLTSNSIKSTELRAAAEYDTLNKTLTRLSAGSRFQFGRGFWAQADFARKNPTFEPGSFFNTFPHDPYYRYSVQGGFDQKKFGLALAFGQTRFKKDAVTDFGVDARLYGFSAGTAVSLGSGDPYMNYAQVRAAYRANIKNKVSLGINAGFYVYDEASFKNNFALQAGMSANWEIVKNLVLNSTFAMRKNVDGVSDPLFSIGLAYFLLKAFE